jgi:hypothetical protein
MTGIHTDAPLPEILCYRGAGKNPGWRKFMARGKRIGNEGLGNYGSIGCGFS